MTRAYNELYLKDAMDNLGEMFDYAQKSCNTKPELIWDLFIASGYADRFASGIPAVVSGKSGTELAMEILGEYDAFQDFPEPRKNGRLSNGLLVRKYACLLSMAHSTQFPGHTEANRIQRYRGSVSQTAQRTAGTGCGGDRPADTKTK